MHTRLIRRLACAAVLLQAAIAPAWAQAPDDEGIGFGVKGGVVRANYRFSEEQDLFNPATGWIIGAFGGGNRAGRLGWQGELNLVRKSTRCGCNQEVVDLYYVQIPALLRANFADRERDGLSVYGLVGPAVELKVGERLGSHAEPRCFLRMSVRLVHHHIHHPASCVSFGAMRFCFWRFVIGATRHSL